RAQHDRLARRPRHEVPSRRRELGVAKERAPRDGDLGVAKELRAGDVERDDRVALGRTGKARRIFVDDVDVVAVGQVDVRLKKEPPEKRRYEAHARALLARGYSRFRSVAYPADY